MSCVHWTLVRGGLQQKLSPAAMPEHWGLTCTVCFLLLHVHCMVKQEAQLTLTNPRDAFSGQSSPNIVPFHMVGIVSPCAIVTLSLRGAVFTVFDFKNVVTLKTRLGVRQGHWKCHCSIECI